jgi:hypothetical protein
MNTPDTLNSRSKNLTTNQNKNRKMKYLYSTKDYEKQGQVEPSLFSWTPR